MPLTVLLGTLAIAAFVTVGCATPRIVLARHTERQRAGEADVLWRPVGEADAPSQPSAGDPQ